MMLVLRGGRGPVVTAVVVLLAAVAGALPTGGAEQAGPTIEALLAGNAQTDARKTELYRPTTDCTYCRKLAAALLPSATSFYY